MFGSLTKRDEIPTQDVLIVISSNGTADIAPVVEIDDERILARGEVDYAVPLGDVRAFVGRRGRIFHYPATEENISDTKRLAALERSIVLRQITHYEKEQPALPAGKLPLGKIMILAAVVILVIIVMVSR